MVSVCPGTNGLKVNAAVSVLTPLTPSTVTMPGLLVAAATVLAKLVTLLLAVVLVNVTAAPVTVPLDQLAEVPEVKVPPAASFRVLTVLMAAAAVFTAIL